MAALGARRAVAIVVAVLMVLAAAGVIDLARPTALSARTTVTSSNTPAPPTSAAAPSSSPTAVSPRAATILGEIRQSGRPAPDLHLPDLSARPPSAGEGVAPTYSSAPAPMGVADLGLTNVSGTLRGSVLDTSSVEGTITLTNALSVNVDGDGPDMFGVQLNAVDTGVTLFDNSSNYFWTQNFVSYTPSSGELVFGDNVWNFSNYDAYLSPNVFYAHGPNGTLYAPVYYYTIGPTFTIHYPFTITFYENSTVLFDRPAVFFNYTVSNSTMRTSGSYDYVVFNSTAGTPTSPYPAGVYQINGDEDNPVGLPSDLELDVVGNDDGDTTTFYQMDASLSIATWDATTRAYVPVTSAMDAGSETGETSDGVSVSFAGATPVAEMQLGPSFLYGLWGMSNDSGAQTIVQTLDPAPIFVFVNPGSALNASASQWVPSSSTGVTTFFLPNGGPYWVEYLLADHTSGGQLLPVAFNSTTALAFTAPVDTALGVYTPLIAFGNGELAALSSAGIGTAAQPYVLDDNQFGSLAPEFAAFNDFQWPVFPGLLLVGTTANVSVTPPSFEIDYPGWMLPTLDALGLPSTNNLQIQLWNATNVRIVGGTISGWLSYELAGFPEGSVIVWNSSNDLIAGATFLDQGDGIVLYGGTNNTIWGNLFLTAPVGATDPSDVLNSGPYTQAVNESESGDLIYNNYFDVPLPAITPTFDPLSCQINCTPAVYTDAWNVSIEPASATATVLGETLTGSILNTWYQGGNYWANYGSQSNPYGVLPYNDSGAIVSGGDYVPLVPYTLYPVTFTEHGLRPGTVWGVSLLVTTMTNATSLSVAAPNGTYEYSVVDPVGYAAAGGNVTVNGSAVSVSLTFVAAVNLTFVEYGIAWGENWWVLLNGSALGGVPENDSAPAGTAIVFAVAPGPYSYLAGAANYTPVIVPPLVLSNGSAAGNVTVGLTPVVVNLTFVASVGLTFDETGLRPGALWTVVLTTAGGTFELATTENRTLVPDALVSAGSYSFTVSAAGYTALPASGNGTLPEDDQQNVTFTPETGVLSGVVQPLGATVTVDGTVTPTTSNGSFSLSVPIGVHSIEVNATGYRTYFNNVTVGAGETTILSIHLASTATTVAGISDLGWALIGVLALLAAIFLVMSLVFAGRRRQPPQGMTPYEPAPAAAPAAWSEGGGPSPPTSEPSPAEPPAPAPSERPDLPAGRSP